MDTKGTYLTKKIRREISSQTNGRVKTFRVNAGKFWQGEVASHTGEFLVLRNPRMVDGLPEGFPDLLAVIPTVVTPDMVGKTIGLAGFVEVKAEGDRIRRKQEEFLALMRAAGCRAGVARSAEDAVKIVTGIPL
jgi:hypothetical protein